MESVKGKNILVTGGTGFVGSHLVEALIPKGARIIVPFRSINPKSYFSTEKLEKHVILAMGDLKDYRRAVELVDKYEIDYVFHLAAQAIVTSAYNNPVETIESNVLGTTHILEACRVSRRVSRIIVASSDKAYGKSNKQYKELDPLRGDHPYEVSKSTTDLIAQAYAKTYGMPIVITRFGNIYGEGDLNFSRIIPGIMKAMVMKETLLLRSNGTFVRDYLYVKDVVGAYLLLLAKMGSMKEKIYNIGSKDTLSVLELIRLSKRILKKPLSYRIVNDAKNEIPYQSLEYKRITQLGWKQQYRLKAVLPRIARWYKRIL